MASSLSIPTHHTRNPDWIDPVARLGYTVKGVVYGLVGMLAIRAAFGAGGSTDGSKGAIREIAQQPFGQILLGITAMGLIGYVIWRMVQTFLDPGDKGTDTKGLLFRAGYFASGVAYAALAITAAKIVLGGNTGGGNSKQEWTARLLDQTFGPWLVGFVGVVIFGVGLYHFYKAYQAKFIKHYDNSEMSAQQKRWAKRIGQFGLSARGVTFLIIGVFFGQAALQSDASEARGLGAALQTLAEQPYGPWLLGVVALGFVAYGVYCFSRARYRRFEVS